MLICEGGGAFFTPGQIPRDSVPSRDYDLTAPTPTLPETGWKERIPAHPLSHRYHLMVTGAF
jgi:hypothetical protein